MAENNSFIANVNKLADKLDVVLQAVDLFDEDVIPVLEEIASLDLQEAVEDLKKGSYLGNRKLDINLSYNMVGIDESTSEEDATSIWLDPTKTVLYDSATALFSDGTTVNIPFIFDGNPINISTHADLLLQLNNNAEFLAKLEDTLISSFAHPVVGEIIRVYDVSGLASNLERLTLHAISGAFKEADSMFFWTKTTSAFQTLAMRVGDIVKIGNEIDNFIALANSINQLLSLQTRIPELVDTYTGDTPNGDTTVYNSLSQLLAIYDVLEELESLATNLEALLAVDTNITDISEVADNIVPNLAVILDSYDNAVSARDYAIEALGYKDSALASANIAIARANEIKNVSVGTVVTAIPSTPASVTYDTSTGKFNFIIPQGVKGDKGDAFQVNAYGTISQRSLYDAQIKDFSFLAIDIGEIYFKLSATSGDWSIGIPFGKGDKGDTGDAGLGIASITFTSTTHPSGNSGQAGGVDTYTITYTDSTTSTFPVANGQSFQLSDSTSKVYVSKQGSDLNNGLTIEKPKLTINSALAQAEALMLAGTTRATVEIMDSSRYQEDIVVPERVVLFGLNASLEGSIVINNGAYVHLYSHYSKENDTVMVTKTGNAHSYYKVVIQDARGVLASLTGCSNLLTTSTNGIFFVEIDLMRINYRGVREETGTGNGHIHVGIKDMYMTANNATAIYATGVESDIIGYVDHIIMLGVLTGTTGIYLDSANGNVDIVCNEIVANTAYNIVNGSLRLNCTKVTGTKTGTPVIDISNIGTAAYKNTGTAIGDVVVQGDKHTRLDDIMVFSSSEFLGYSTISSGMWGIVSSIIPTALTSTNIISGTYYNGAQYNPFFIMFNISVNSGGYLRVDNTLKSDSNISFKIYKHNSLNKVKVIFNLTSSFRNMQINVSSININGVGSAQLSWTTTDNTVDYTENPVTQKSLMNVGDFGFGGTTELEDTDANNINVTKPFFAGSQTANNPFSNKASSNGTHILNIERVEGTISAQIGLSQKTNHFGWRTKAGSWQSWEEGVGTTLVQTLTNKTLEAVRVTEKAFTATGTSGTITINCANGNKALLTPTGNITSWSFTNVPSSGNSYILNIQITGSGTVRSVAYPTSIKWKDDEVPEINWTSGRKTFIILETSDGGTSWEGRW